MGNKNNRRKPKRKKPSEAFKFFRLRHAENKDNMNMGGVVRTKQPEQKDVGVKNDEPIYISSDEEEKIAQELGTNAKVAGTIISESQNEIPSSTTESSPLISRSFSDNPLECGDSLNDARSGCEQDRDSKKVDLRLLCRMCSNDVGDAPTDLLSSSNNFAQVLHQYLEVKVVKDDPLLPSHICKKCRNHLQAWTLLAHHVKYSQRFFQSQLDKLNSPSVKSASSIPVINVPLSGEFLKLKSNSSREKRPQSPYSLTNYQFVVVDRADLKSDSPEAVDPLKIPEQTANLSSGYSSDFVICDVKSLAVPSEPKIAINQAVKCDITSDSSKQVNVLQAKDAGLKSSTVPRESVAKVSGSYTNVKPPVLNPSQVSRPQNVQNSTTNVKSVSVVTKEAATVSQSHVNQSQSKVVSASPANQMGQPRTTDNPTKKLKVGTDTAPVATTQHTVLPPASNATVASVAPPKPNLITSSPTPNHPQNTTNPTLPSAAPQHIPNSAPNHPGTVPNLGELTDIQKMNVMLNLDYLMRSSPPPHFAYRRHGYNGPPNMHPAMYERHPAMHERHPATMFYPNEPHRPPPYYHQYHHYPRMQDPKFCPCPQNCNCAARYSNSNPEPANQNIRPQINLGVNKSSNDSPGVNRPLNQSSMVPNQASQVSPNASSQSRPSNHSLVGANPPQSQHTMQQAPPPNYQQRVPGSIPCSPAVTPNSSHLLHTLASSQAVGNEQRPLHANSLQSSAVRGSSVPQSQGSGVQGEPKPGSISIKQLSPSTSNQTNTAGPNNNNRANVIGPNSNNDANIMGPNSNNRANIMGPNPNNLGNSMGPNFNNHANIPGPNSNNHGNIMGPNNIPNTMSPNFNIQPRPLNLPPGPMTQMFELLNHMYQSFRQNQPPIWYGNNPPPMQYANNQPNGQNGPYRGPGYPPMNVSYPGRPMEMNPHMAGVMNHPMRPPPQHNGNEASAHAPQVTNTEVRVEAEQRGQKRPLQ